MAQTALAETVADVVIEGAAEVAEAIVDEVAEHSRKWLKVFLLLLVVGAVVAVVMRKRSQAEQQHSHPH
jgi:hypothetical protein